MSELGDLASALSAISKSLTSIEAHVANQDANCTQLREGLHGLRNQLQATMLEKGRTDRAVEQIEVWVGDFGRKLHEVTKEVTTARNRVELLADEVTRGFREDRAELRRLKGTDEETTQA